MNAVTTWLLAATVSVAQVSVPMPPRQIHVDCTIDGALQRALARAHRHRAADFVLHGICRESVVLTTDGVTIRGATPDSGLASPAAGGAFEPVVEVVDAQVSLRGMVVQDGYIGVLARGWDADVLLFDVHLVNNNGGVIASRGGTARLIDATVRDGEVGVEAQFNGELNLQNVVVSGHDTAISAFDKSRAALTDVTVENNRVSGVLASIRSDVNIVGGAFRENGQVHISSGRRSDVALLWDVIVGSEADGTQIALGAKDHASIESFTTPLIHGAVRGLDGGSIRLGNTMIEGVILLSQFSDAYVFNTEVSEGISCESGSDAVCQGSAIPMVSGCPSPTCGAASSLTTEPHLDAPEHFAMEARPFDTRCRPVRSR